MTELSNIQLTIDINDPQLSSETNRKAAESLMHELRNIEGVERVEPTEKPSPELLDGEQKGLELLLGVLTAEINLKNIKKVLDFLSDRLHDKPIKIKVKLKDREVEVQANSREEMLAAKEIIDEIIESLQEKPNG